jgi:hypothetical protein
MLMPIKVFASEQGRFHSSGETPTAGPDTTTGDSLVARFQRLAAVILRRE